MSMKHGFISDDSLRKQSWTLTARVVRAWFVQDYKNKKLSFSMKLVLMDRKVLLSYRFIFYLFLFKIRCFNLCYVGWSNWCVYTKHIDQQTSSRSSSKREWCSRFSHLMLLATMVRIDHQPLNTNWISQSTQKWKYLKLLWSLQTCIRLHLHLMVSDYHFLRINWIM